MLLKIKDIVWENFKLPFKIMDIVCIATSSMTDRPIIGMIVDIQFNLKGRIIQYIVSYENQKSFFYEEELIMVEQNENKNNEIGFKK